MCCLFFFNDTATTEIYTLSLHDALPICHSRVGTVPGFSAGKSTPVSLPKPQSSSIFCISCTRARGVLTVSALTSSRCQGGEARVEKAVSQEAIRAWRRLMLPRLGLPSLAYAWPSMVTVAGQL